MGIPGERIMGAIIVIAFGLLIIAEIINEVHK